MVLTLRGHKVTGWHLRRPRELFNLIVGRSPRKVKTSAPLRFLHEVIGLERFHYGFWDGEPQTVEGLKAAQLRYAEKLHSWIPEGVTSILDVGCGIGTDSLSLARRGFEIEGLSPDPYQRQHFERLTSLPFHLSRLQEFVPDHPYDLVLMSESAQYIWLDSLFGAVHRCTPSGYLLVSDYFRVNSGEDGGDRSGHLLDDFLTRAAEEGFALVGQEDITDQVLPTLELATFWLNRYIAPGSEVARDWIAGRVPALFRFGSILLRRRIEKIPDWMALLEPDEFKKRKRYVTLLFRVGEAD